MHPAIKNLEAEVRERMTAPGVSRKGCFIALKESKEFEE